MCGCREILLWWIYGLNTKKNISTKVLTFFFCIVARCFYMLWEIIKKLRKLKLSEVWNGVRKAHLFVFSTNWLLDTWGVTSFIHLFTWYILGACCCWRLSCRLEATVTVCSFLLITLFLEGYSWALDFAWVWPASISL